MQIENPQTQTQSRNENEDCTEQNIHLNKINQCRICLEAQVINQPQSKLISPCKCTGTLQYVHQICLQQWISKLVIKSGGKVKSGKAHIFCQLCNSKIYFKTQTKLKFKSKQLIKTHFCQNIKTFILLMLLLIINLGFFAALLNYLLFVGFKILIQNNVVLVSLMISGQVIFSIVAVVTLVCLLNKYLLQRETRVYQIMDRAQQQTFITDQGHGCLKKKRQTKYLQTLNKNQSTKPQ